MNRIQKGINAGLSRGLSGYLWLLKILVPISFATALLVYSGWLYKLDFLIEPVMGLLSLPASAALPLIIGILTGIYGAIAAMAALSFSLNQTILIANFLLISHNLIQESIVQGKAGFNPVFAALFRLGASVVITWIVSLFLSSGPAVLEVVSGTVASQADLTLAVMLKTWAWDILLLSIKIFIIIMPLMICLELMKEFKLIQHIVTLATPVLRLLGLSRSAGILWLTAAIFGLAYGSAVIVEETKTTTLSPDELSKLHLSIGINHAMIEDPALFLPLGIPPFWLWVPRFIAAVALIQCLHLLTYVRRLYAERTGHKKLCNH